MYLAPFNYDRFFERVFKHTHIAKKFLEDFLDVEIEEIELLVLNAFIKNDVLWKSMDTVELLAHREKILEVLNNDTKNLNFLSKNRLIFALQPNIVKNHKDGKSEILERFVPWFNFAEKTRNKNNKAEDFESFKNEPIIMEVIDLLKTTNISEDDIQYITDYDDYEKGVAVFKEMILEEGRVNWIRAEKEKIQVEQEKIQVEQEKKQIEKALLNSIEKCLKRGDSLVEIADFFDVDVETMKTYIKMIPNSQS
jgi:hypothetical protein